MPLVVSEWDVLKAIGELKSGSRVEIGHAVGISPANLVHICSHLLTEGYLKLMGRGRYALSPQGERVIAPSGHRLEEKKLTVDRELIKDVASEVAKEVAKEIRLKEAKAHRVSEKERIKIKTGYIPPPDYGEIELESNIERIGVETEKEKSDIDKSVELFKNIEKTK